ncbi:DUF512 domain-containing protein [Butyrivibrio sp. MC2013]|uniref:DUF512 domain-containing protein n=1 Tax=Butyrivibrio sp. MC2013 TaxID=1280686 RepID=UPI0004108B27|nr:DUF512 domain-containing protein [Butyrivibrio sp. MC2013]
MQKDIKGHLIKEVNPGSIAEEVGIEVGDYLLAINDNEIKDIFDYQYFTENEEVNVLIQKRDGEPWLLEIEKDEDEDLGIVFDNGLMDNYRSCHNKCIFCFIDQMPPGMRETLYFKDDDSRLSFLQGNYVTLTNMSDEDLERIIRYHLSPINVSVQTTNPELRNMMMGNRFAGDALKKLHRLCDPANGLELNGQIVLCKGINDGAELRRSLSDLYAMRPSMVSLSVVPVGLSRFREGLYPLEPFEKEDAGKVIEEISYWQEKSYREYGDHFVHASDEWYMIAGLPIPGAEIYDGYGQLENGVGMVRLMLDDFYSCLDRLKARYKEDPEFARHIDERRFKCSSVTGRLIYPWVKEMADKLMEFCPGLDFNVIEVVNHFFGERITVTGLLTGRDIIDRVKQEDAGEVLLLPGNVLRAGENYLLDDITVEDIERELQIPVEIIDSSEDGLVRRLLGI